MPDALPALHLLDASTHLASSRPRQLDFLAFLFGFNPPLQQAHSLIAPALHFLPRGLAQAPPHPSGFLLLRQVGKSIRPPAVRPTQPICPRTDAQTWRCACLWAW